MAQTSSGRRYAAPWAAISMDFCCDETDDEYVHRLEPRSLVLLYGDARWMWRHSIAQRRTDTVHGQKIARQRRLSITFRTIVRPEPSQA